MSKPSEPLSLSPEDMGELKYVKIEVGRTNFIVQAAFTDRQSIIDFLNKWMPQEAKPPF